MRARRMQDAGNRQIKVDLVARQPGERGRSNRDAVIGFLPADDFLFLRAAERIVHIPNELDLGVVGLRTRIAEKHFGDRHRRDLFELLGKFNRRIVALAAEQMAERQLAHLCCRGFDQFLVAVAERRTPQAREPFDIGFAAAVVEMDALPALDHQRPGLPKCIKLGVGMNQRFDIAGGKIGQHGGGPIHVQGATPRI